MHLYREFAPHPALAGHVACLWTSQALPDGTPLRRRILPDNCIDILWQDRAPLGFVAGMMSRAHRFETPQPLRTVAVRLRPGAARALFDLPLHVLQDAHPALDALWPHAEAEALGAELWEHERTPAQQLATIEGALLARLRDRAACALAAGSAAPAGRLTDAALRLIDGTGGAVRIGALAQSLGVSRQHLNQQFRDRVGLNAKTYAMVSRFGRAGAALRAAHGAAARDIDWAGLALDCGYYDQSHLIHEFRLFADQTPQAFALGRSGAATTAGGQP
ncbi:AraC family transcriptional regulator [Massilia forsythiae]|uniref:AraC family transcriptional regulator n=1 Tax=Massilia forsythiae TaxID=2728020 RepID=A0A7Z2VUL3_9BURK|nr:helix-turn-helix domain-containing protein [Massilia forsythiae]QJD99256.1 AraC family transcriptional regulator [Massilia forsythiae]